MKTINLVAAGTALALMSVLGCNKEPTQTATTTSKVTPAPAATNQPSAATPEQAGPTMDGEMTDQMRASCPMAVPGADVEVKDTDAGIALSFSTQKGDAADLRTRVERMAQMYELHHGHGAMIWHSMMGEQGGPGRGAGHMGSGNGMGSSNGTGSGNGMMGHMSNGMGTGQMGNGGPMPAAKATVEPTSQGARLMLTPTDASQLDALRKQVRNHQERMHSGQCWMLKQQGAAGPGE